MFDVIVTISCEYNDSQMILEKTYVDSSPSLVMWIILIF